MLSSRLLYLLTPLQVGSLIIRVESCDRDLTAADLDRAVRFIRLAEEDLIGVEHDLPCAVCGGPHRFDTSIPSAVWNDVIRKAGIPEFLCANCIIDAFVKAGTGFTAELSGAGLNGHQIQVIVDGHDGNVATRVSDENTMLRARIRELQDSAKR